MGQRVYLPKDTEFDIGQIHLTPATTNIGTAARHVYQPYRPHGENYGRWKPDEFGRSFSLAGVYDGPEADAFYALQGAGAVAARLLVDKGHNNRIHAGEVLASGYEITAATETITTVTGAAPISGTVYIGEGDQALDETLEVPTTHNVVILVVRQAGDETAAERGNIGFRATNAGESWVVSLDIREQVGVFISPFPLQSSGGTQGHPEGNWTIAASAGGYDTDPVISWSLARPEGKFD